MTHILERYSNVKALIVGDVMLDRYYFGETQRISPEAPVPVVRVKNQQERPGGAGNVALNVAALGGQAKLSATVGDDEAGKTLENELQAVDVEPLFVRQSESTIVKQRVLSQNQQLIRMDFEGQMTANPQEIIKQFKQQLDWANVIILSDYAKGLLDDCSAELIALAKQKNIPVLVDPKRSDFSGYRGATLVTPNFKEFQEVVGECATETDVLDRGRELMRSHDIDVLLVTRGAQGMTLLMNDEPEIYLAAKGREVFDVTGAGDTVISVMAASLACGDTPFEAVELGNTAAGIVIGKLGAATVSVDELKQVLAGYAPNSAGVVNENELIMHLKEARAAGDRIIFTNGCFDVLHAMHVEYLEMAKALGDKLIVAVNDDESITRLKGEGRPVNKLEQRMAVLAGLQSVDWVLSFKDDTPNRLLELIKPDVLAKGGDYGIEGVVGADIVTAYGGEAVVLGGVKEGVKSTAIIERMRQLKNHD